MAARTYDRIRHHPRATRSHFSSIPILTCWSIYSLIAMTTLPQCWRRTPPLTPIRRLPLTLDRLRVPRAGADFRCYRSRSSRGSTAFIPSRAGRRMPACRGLVQPAMCVRTHARQHVSRRREWSVTERTERRIAQTEDTPFVYGAGLLAFGLRPLLAWLIAFCPLTFREASQEPGKIRSKRRPACAGSPHSSTVMTVLSRFLREVQHLLAGASPRCPAGEPLHP
jgi:hypothetical protein